MLDHCLQGAKQVKHVTTMKPLGGSLESGQEGSGCNSLFQGSKMFAAMMLRIAITSECLLFLLAFKLLTVSYISYISQICWFARVKAHVCRLCRSIMFFMGVSNMLRPIMWSIFPFSPFSARSQSGIQLHFR